MNKSTKRAVVAASVVVASVALAMSVAASSSEDTPLQGSALERAGAAALEHVGGGTVIETEVGDDGAAYGVEIRLEDGSVVEVALDSEFNPTDISPDDDGPRDSEDEVGGEAGS